MFPGGIGRAYSYQTFNNLVLLKVESLGQPCYGEVTRIYHKQMVLDCKSEGNGVLEELNVDNVTIQHSLRGRTRL